MRQVLLIVGLLSANLARADEDPDLLIARGHFEKGKARFAAQDWAGALREFEAAREAKSVPQFVYNVALCHERLGHLREAVAAYRAYAGSIVDGEELAAVKERIAGLEERLRGMPEPAPTAAPGPAPRKRSWVVPVLLGVAALAVAVAGTIVVGTVAADYGPLSMQWDQRPSSDLVARAGDLQTRAGVGYALWGAAGALAAADLVSWIVVGASGGAEATAASPR
jgi:hypothetical protein